MVLAAAALILGSLGTSAAAYDIPPLIPVSGAVTSDSGAAVASGQVAFAASCEAWSQGHIAWSVTIHESSYSVALWPGSYVARVYPDNGTGSPR